MKWSNPTKFTVVSIDEFHVPEEFDTIHKAIDSATSGTRIIVSTGTYYENINFNGKNVILKSTNPEDFDVVESTVINGSNSGSVITFSGNETEKCILTGFTITGGEGLLWMLVSTVMEHWQP